jgi:hypothetical protein
MWLAITAIVGFVLGATTVFFLLESKRSQAASHDAAATQQAEQAARDRQEAAKLTAGLARATSYAELERESLLLKQDLRNLDTTINKLKLDREAQARSQAALDERCEALAKRYLADVAKWASASITTNNYSACKQRLTKAIEWSKELGLRVSAEDEASLLESLKQDFEQAVRQSLAREEQARIKQKLREEQQRERDIKREMDTLERERAAIQAALTKALADAHDSHSEEIERLKAKLSEAEERNRRAIAQAQLTRAGHIYVISNFGSFGPDVFKIGMTRRLEPMDRIAELGDASVPFPFDVHMMISCEDAPSLENALHRHFHLNRINKVNPRKEFFKVTLEDIAQIVESKHGKVDYIADADALEYRQSMSMTVDDQEYIEQAFEASAANDDDEKIEA